ncbi:unnamed protein product [Darwinula stevensoni]|uniref:Uncharacterized protein n=1 Tax=Darwinula stevensoni TaxID=69355 RepID=A0A7R8XID7_9CRUS|nr:unnamed protein product [Darwinula stevensoni]CAG0894240.1 unnamed protein product [Darwinula stevensoni]
MSTHWKKDCEESKDPREPLDGSDVADARTSPSFCRSTGSDITCYCETDLCNAGMPLSPSLALLVAVFALLRR